MTQTNTRRSAWGKVLILSFLLAALLSATMMLAASPAHAETTFTVNNTGDSADTNLSDGLCDSSSLAGIQCTLRAAIQEANDTPGADAIAFGIPGDFVRTIFPTSALPAITEAVTIDGYTQTGASANTLEKGTNAVLKIQLDGSNAEGNFVDGLDVDANNVVIRGLAINRFDNDGIDILNRTGVKIEGNFIGTSASGTLDLGNGASGVFVEGDSNAVGGTLPSQRNLISGNGRDGVVVFLDTQNARVEGNLIGTSKDGITALGNTGDGVDIINSSGNFVGGSVASAANTIAFNSEDGVNVSSAAGLDATGNRILGNSIFSNGGLGMDLVGGTENAAGATENDPGDSDTGVNDLQNKPAITSAKTAGGKTTIEGKLNSTPNDRFQIQFFSNPSGNEGKKFLGSRTVFFTDSTGNATFTFTPSQAIPAGQRITATATDVIDGNTSEFSAPRTVVAQ